MSKQEFQRLLGYHYAKQNRPTPAVNVTPRAFAKANGQGRGQKFLKGGYIKQDCHIERVFVNPRPSSTH